MLSKGEHFTVYLYGFSFADGQRTGVQGEVDQYQKGDGQYPLEDEEREKEGDGYSRV